MAKYRKCPSCGANNPPNLLSCKECGYDSLGYEKILDDTIPVEENDTSKDEEKEPPAPTNTPEMVRICDCGCHNPIKARKCANCGEDISDIIPVAEDLGENKENTIHYILSSLDGEYAFELVDNLTFIGREHFMKEYLSQKTYVSRKQAEFLIENGKLYIKNLSTTNHTFVNNEMISDDKYIELSDGDEIGLGGMVLNGTRQDEAAYMMVRIGSCT